MGKLLRADKSKVSWGSNNRAITELECLGVQKDSLGWYSPVSDSGEDVLDYVRQKIRDEEEHIDQIEQLIIEVTQIEVKYALKLLLSKADEVLGILYKAHADYNDKYFHGKLSMPLITIDRLSHRTLSKYTVGTDSSGIENHIVLNRSFVALNTKTRLLENLKHEMIHQYQDEILYEKHNENGELIHPGEKRPKDWHNKDFQAMSKVVGIPAEGPKCYGSPAKMPEVKSYNRKFVCGCVASNGYPVTIWSTREVKAVCSVCHKPFTEVQKSGDVIPVASSDVEAAGQDAVEIRMRNEFTEFQKFKERDSLETAIRKLEKQGIAYKEGIYQKGHNSYLHGYIYWLAYTSSEKTLPVVKEARAPYTKISSRLKRGAPKHE